MACIFPPPATYSWDSVNWSGSSVVTYPNTPDRLGRRPLGKINAQPKCIIEDMGETQESSGSLTMETRYRNKGTTIIAYHRAWQRRDGRRRGHAAINLRQNF